MVPWLKRNWWGVSFYGGCVLLVIGGVAFATCVGGELKDRAAIYSAVVASGALLATVLKHVHDSTEKSQERVKKREAESASPIFKVSESGFYLMGSSDKYGMIPRVKWESATWVRYRFTLNTFNERPENLGLTSIEIQYRHGGDVIYRQAPTEHTVGQFQAPVVYSITLHAKNWTTYEFGGGTTITDREALTKCDGIYLAATSIKGEDFVIRLADRIFEAVDQ
jgi:hypothetical protein